MLIHLRDRQGYEALGKTDEAVKSTDAFTTSCPQPAQV